MPKCLECGFEAPNIEPHVREEHDLETYLAKHDADVTDLIDESLLKKAKASKTEKKSKGVIAAFNLHGIDIPHSKEENHAPYTPEESYHFFDEKWGPIAQDINAKRNVLFTGHCGVGKTSGVVQLAARTSQGVLRLNLNGQTTISDFVGFWTVKGGETVWVDGALPTAMKLGLWLIIDEVDFGEAEILSVLNSVLEKGGKLFLKEKGNECITPHENFRVFGTANTVGCMSHYRGLYQGANIMNEAFLDRWQVYHVGYLPADKEAEVLQNSIPKMNAKIAGFIVKVGNMIRESFEKEEISCTFSLRRMIDWGTKMVEMKDHIKAAESTILNKIAPEEAETVRGIIQRVMGSKS